MSSENKNGKVPLISKIAYGFGDVGCNFSWMFVSNFLMIFYTDVFGISMAAVSALMLFSRFWDAINDPIVGGLSLIHIQMCIRDKLERIREIRASERMFYQKITELYATAIDYDKEVCG